MAMTISDDLLAAAHVTDIELKREFAIALFHQDRLTLAQASRLSEISQLAFQALLADRQIPVHYGVQEFREDFETFARATLDCCLRHIADLEPCPDRSARTATFSL